jgi:hypothetical protein
VEFVDVPGSRRRHGLRTALRWIAPLVALRLLWIIVFRTRPKIVIDWVRHFNNKVLNPVMLRMAGHRHFSAARLEHSGRRSGKTFATPPVAVPVSGGYAIPLPYGMDVDWCHNLQAAGGGALEVEGRWHPVTHPVVIPFAALRGQLPRRWRLAAAVYGIRDWLVVATEPGGSPSQEHNGKSVGAVHIEGEVVIRRPVEVVFDFVADERNEPIYNPRMRHVEQLSAGPVGRGTRFRAETTNLGRPVGMIIEFTDYAPPHRLGSVTRMSSMQITGAVTFNPVPDGTRMRWSWEMRPYGVLRLLRPVLATIGRRQEHAIWAGLKQNLEERCARLTRDS